MPDATEPPSNGVDASVVYEQERVAASAYAPLYDRAYETPFWVAERRSFVRRVVDYARRNGIEIRTARVLDVGSGTGAIVGHLLEQGVGDVSGNDLSADMVKLASARFPGVRFTLGPAEEIDVPAGSLDVVTGFSVLHHLPDLGRFFTWLESALRPGGVFGFSDPNANSILNEPRWSRHLSRLAFPVHEILRRRNREALSGIPDMADERYYTDTHRSLTAEEVRRALPAGLTAEIASHGAFAPILNSAAVDRRPDRVVLNIARAIDSVLPIEGVALVTLGRRA